MKREEQIKQAAKEYADDSPDKVQSIIAQVGFEMGAEWADAHPHWISVDDEMPKTETEVLMVSSGNADPMCGYRCRVGKNRWYCYNDDGYWHNITHWMPMPKMPVLYNSENIGKDEEGGEQ